MKLEFQFSIDLYQSPIQFDRAPANPYHTLSIINPIKLYRVVYWTNLMLRMLAHSQNKKFIIYFQSAISPSSICILLLPNFKTELFFSGPGGKGKETTAWKKYLIPNPHSAKLQFYNAIMKDICKNGAEKTYRGDLQQYLIDQRQYGWVVHSNIIHLQSRHQQLLVDKETEDGWGKCAEVKIISKQPHAS